MPYIRNYIGLEKNGSYTSHRIQFVMSEKKPMNVATVRKILKELRSKYENSKIAIYASTITNRNICIKTELDQDIRSLSKKEFKDMEDDYMLNYNKIFDPSKFESYFSITAYIRMLQQKKAPKDKEDALYNKIKNFKAIHVTNDTGRRSERLSKKQKR